MSFSRILLLVFFILCLFLGVAINLMSVGQYYGIYIVVLLPAIGLHVMSGLRAWKFFPKFNWPIILSSICFPGFSLFRLDIDAHGLFNGYGAVMARIGAAATEHIDPWEFSLELSLVLLLAMIFIDTYVMWYKGKGRA